MCKFAARSHDQKRICRKYINVKANVHLVSASVYVHEEVYLHMWILTFTYMQLHSHAQEYTRCKLYIYVKFTHRVLISACERGWSGMLNIWCSIHAFNMYILHTSSATQYTCEPITFFHEFCLFLTNYYCLDWIWASMPRGSVNWNTWKWSE